MSQVLVINPGGTSTKIAVFRGDEALFTKTIDHPAEKLQEFPTVYDQKEFRTQMILDTLKEEGIALSSLDAVIGRGGLVRPIPGGVYPINQNLLDDMKAAPYGEHASNLGSPIAYEIAQELGIPSYIMDPVSVDEIEDVARISGLKALPRISQLHTLNSRAVARKYCEEQGWKYEEKKLVVAHLGGGISITPHLHGRIIDCNNPMDAGPMCPDRAGTLPIRGLIKLCYSGQFKTVEDMLRKVTREGGLYDHLGTKDLRDAEKLADDGDEYADLVLRAMSYQIAKEIAAMASVLYGDVDAIVLTGGMANSERLTEDIKKRCGFIAEVVLRPGEKEMEALADGAMRALAGEAELMIY